MSIQSKSVRILAVVSVLALASACGEGVEGAEPQQSPAQLAPDSLKEQEAAIDPDNYDTCPGCRLDFWGIGPNGNAGGWACDYTYPDYYLWVRIDKWNGYDWQEGNWGQAYLYNGGLSSVCGGSPYHQFDIPTSYGPSGKFRVIAQTVLGDQPGYGLIVRTFYKW